MKQPVIRPSHCAKLGIFSLAYFALGAGVALAGDIANLSGKDQVVEVGVAQNLQPVTIPNGTTYHGIGEMQVRYKGSSEITIHYYEEYAIWPGDTFGPQELINRGFGNTFR